MQDYQNFENVIAADNLSLILSQEEKESIAAALNEQEIGLLFVEKRSMVQAVFQTVYLYINENLTELIIAGLIAPAAYDAIKSTVSRIVDRMRKRLKNPEREAAVVSLKLESGNVEITAPIPTTLTDEQFSQYMDMLRASVAQMSSDQDRDTKARESFIAECVDENGSISIRMKTIYRD